MGGGAREGRGSGHQVCICVYESPTEMPFVCGVTGIYVHLIGVEYLVVECDVEWWNECTCMCVCACMRGCGGECDWGWASFHPAPADPEYGCRCL